MKTHRKMPADAKHTLKVRKRKAEVLRPSGPSTRYMYLRNLIRSVIFGSGFTIDKIYTEKRKQAGVDGRTMKFFGIRMSKCVICGQPLPGFKAVDRGTGYIKKLNKCVREINKALINTDFCATLVRGTYSHSIRVNPL